MAVAVEFSTIPEMFRKITTKYAGSSRAALMYKEEDQYKSLGYAQLRLSTDLLAFGLAAMGVRRGDRVAIISENRPEWVISDQAILILGGVVVPIYPTMTSKQTEFIFNDAGVRFAIVSNQFQLTKVMRVFNDIRTLEKVVLMAEKEGISEPSTIGFAAVMEMGRKNQIENSGVLDAAMSLLKPEDLLTLIYTSGTTGIPKGVMLTHWNLCSNIRQASTVLPIGEDDVLLSFLPLSHSFERMAGYYTAFACGATIAYAESVETVRENMMEVKPTIITTVPRLFERIHARALKQIENGTALKRKIFYWAIRTGRAYAAARRRGAISPALALKSLVADRLVYSKLRERTGGRLRFFVSGGAALAKEFGEFFESIGLKIIEGYGLTESSPVIAANPFDAYKFGSVGLPIPGVEVTIASDGEILARGPNIMKGYWNNPLATREAIDEDGWLHTGDIGMLDAEGYLHITDRKKHLFVSSGGKNIAPQPIENLFLSSKYIEQFMLVGDRRMFLTALIVPDFDALKEFADSQQICYSNNSELVKDPRINELIEQNIADIQKDLANYERVRRFTILEKQFSVEEGELTPTLKIRRKIVEERYAHLIERMYKGIS